MYYNIRNIIDKKISVCIARRGYGKSLQAEKERKILEERIKREEKWKKI